jgi:hypothetical protein
MRFVNFLSLAKILPKIGFATKKLVRLGMGFRPGVYLMNDRENRKCLGYLRHPKICKQKAPGFKPGAYAKYILMYCYRVVIPSAKTTTLL